MLLTGACLCSAIAYEFSCAGGEVADYCHCRQCQKSSGAPVLAWIQVAPSNFRVTRGQAKAYGSSAHSTRWFCPNCGTPLYMTDREGRSVGITLGTLDTPNAIHPTVHGWDCERLAWFATTDSLPRYAKAPPYDL
ncbi:hypothetical protein GCM10010909_02980 [Acidocella aquatica]|uniref:CENP-V/GFA domain-containing protein n=1 Tax=Acidocella aquatica TaxID=1922313 RepID=A0ABQ5ZZH5_9PROT|nr:GFA family protein [Acidocella aquatica]GLR65620.1 hypothetical protein GCM10010909_02980 [Acidocella aquatica]